MKIKLWKFKDEFSLGTEWMNWTEISETKRMGIK